MWPMSLLGIVSRSSRWVIVSSVYPDCQAVVCSKNSLHTGTAMREIERALKREDKEHKNILFPITFDNCIFDEWEHNRKTDVLAKVVGEFRDAIQARPYMKRRSKSCSWD
jgi:hypothetical protein